MMLALISVVTAASLVRALDANGLARTPQMGWNTWNYFGCSISEDTILGAAQKIADSGLKSYGYEYVLMDDCWQAATRDPSTSAPQPDPAKFPNGIKDMSDKIHAMGLKIGIYSDAGSMTCGGRFGSLGYEAIDAKTYAEWEIDYLKYDNCYNEGQSGAPLISYNRYNNMSVALNETGRPILYSMCNWGDDQPWNWATTIANSWRISGDIHDDFSRIDDRCPCDSMLDCELPGYHCSVARIIDFSAPLGQKAGPGRWNDLDMLEVGNGGMTYDEYVTHFSMWAIVKSPLILGNDVTHMTNQTLSIITNSAIIAVNQDSLGSPAVRIWRQTLENSDPKIAGTPSLQLWAGSLVNDSTVVALLNTGSKNQTVDVQFKDVFVDSSSTVQNAQYRVYDLWQKSSSAGYGNITSWGKDMGIHEGVMERISIGPHQTKVWKFVPVASGATAGAFARRAGEL